MATEKELQLDTTAEPKSNKKMIIIIIAAVLVVGIGVAAALLLMSGGDSDEAEEVVEETAETVSDPADGPAIYIKFKPEFIVNYQVGPRQRYLQVYMEAMTRNPGVAEALEMHSPMIRNAIITLLGQQSFDYLRSPEGRDEVREKLKQEIQRLVNQETGIEGGLDEILFTNYVMQ